jgi:alpha-glucosidase
VDWEQTRVLDARIGDHVVVARQARDSDEWFLGAITDEEGREIRVSLDFLEPGVRYVAEVYRDGEGAHWKDNPLAFETLTMEVGASDALTLRLAPGGGQAVRFRPVEGGS